MVSQQPHGLIGLTGLFGLLLLSFEASIKEVRDAGDQPRDSGGDAGDGNLDVVQIAVLVRSGQVVGAEGAEQQGQEKIQHLQTNSWCLNLQLISCKYEVGKQTKNQRSGYLFSCKLKSKNDRIVLYYQSNGNKHTNCHRISSDSAHWLCFGPGHLVHFSTVECPLLWRILQDSQVSKQTPSK